MNDLKILSELISIRSDNRDGREILNYLKEKLKDEVIEIKCEEGKRFILVGINTRLNDINPIVLSGHIDTVNADEEKYLTNPYKLVIKEDKAYGLGVIDMKCFTSSVIELIDTIKKCKYPIVLALTTDEETELLGVKNIISEFKKLNIKPKFTIVGEPTNMKINNVSNGCYEYKVEVYGKSCHSSVPSNGINSIYILAKIVTYIEELSNRYSDLVMNSNIISGGTLINRIPDYASVSFDIRTINVNNYNEVIELLNIKIKELEEEYKAKIDLTKKLEIPPLNCKNSNLIKSLANDLNLKIESFTGGCEAGYYQAYSGDAILFGVGNIDLAHKPNEYMIVSDYNRYNKLLVEMIYKLKDVFYK